MSNSFKLNILDNDISPKYDLINNDLLLENNLINNDYSLNIEILNNDLASKLTQILNEFNLKFTVDNISKILNLMFIMNIETFDINNSMKLVQQLKCEDLFENQDIETSLKILQNLMMSITQENGEINKSLKLNQSLNYEDVFNMILEVNIKLYQTLKVDLKHDNIDISTSDIKLIIYKPVANLKTIIMGDLKTITLNNFYYTEV